MKFPIHSFSRLNLRAPETNAAKQSGSAFRAIACALLVAALCVDALATSSSQHNVVTQHGDVRRDGQYSNETYLTPGNVNPNQFGSLFSYAVDGYVVAQPLYMYGVNIPGVGVVNVTYVVTAHDSVYAFNADTPGTGAPLWHVSLLNSANGATVTTEPVSALGCSFVNGFTEVGIIGTPVIDATTNTIYLVAKTMEVTNSVTSYIFRLHALDITTGAEKFGGPVVINATLGSLTLNGQVNLQRPALLELNGTIYISASARMDAIKTPTDGCSPIARRPCSNWVCSTLLRQKPTALRCG